MDQPMSFFGALEIVDRAGQVLHRVRIERLPFRIGRALDNDLVLDDAYVCAHHAQIQSGESLELVDNDSVNGSFVATQTARQSRLALGTSADLRLGHTLLRFRGADEQLAATLSDPLIGSRWLRLDRWQWGAIGLGGCALVVMADNVVGSAQPLRPGLIIGSVAPALIVLALWALVWSLVNRVLAHRFHYFGHLAIGGFGVIAGSVIETLTGYAGFAWAADTVVPVIASISAAILIGAVIFGHLRLISRGNARALLLPAGLIGIGFLALVLLPNAADERFSSEPKFAASLKPPPAALRAGRSTEIFYADATRALDAADAEAANQDD